MTGSSKPSPEFVRRNKLAVRSSKFIKCFNLTQEHVFFSAWHFQFHVVIQHYWAAFPSKVFADMHKVDKGGFMYAHKSCVGKQFFIFEDRLGCTGIAAIGKIYIGITSWSFAIQDVLQLYHLKSLDRGNAKPWILAGRRSADIMQQGIFINQLVVYMIREKILHSVCAANFLTMKIWT